MVPKLVPVAVEMIAHAMNAATTYAPPLSPIAFADHASAPTNPLAFSSEPSTPENSQAQSMIITMRWLMPSSIASA